MQDTSVQAEQSLLRMSRGDINPFSRGVIMEPWSADFVDVPEIHGDATREIASLVNKVKREGKSRARLLIGDSATGKSHVLARVRREFSDRVFFCFSEPLTGAGENVFRHIWGNIARNLLRPIAAKHQPQFHRVWRDFFLGVATNRREREENFRAWTENRKFDFTLQVDDQLKASGRSVDFLLLGVLYEYARNHRANPRIRAAAEHWLRSSRVNDEQLELLDLPGDSCIDSEDKAKDMIKSAGVITSFSRPMFLCFDQVETYLLDDRAFQAFVQAVDYIIDYTSNYAVVTAALLTFDEKLRTGGLPPSSWDRFNCASRPISIRPLSPEEGAKLLTARLRADTGPLEITRTKPLFPFCSKDLDEILTPAGACVRTRKQARYILQDAELVFGEILASRPSVEEIELYCEEDSPLRRKAGEPRPVKPWPDEAAVDAYLDGKFRDALSYYRRHPQEVGVDDTRNREIVLDLMLQALELGTDQAGVRISNVTIYSRKRRDGCDFSLTLSAEGRSATVGVLFCDDSRANVIGGLTRKAAALLRAKTLERLIYVRDSRAGLTQKGRKLLSDFRREFESDAPAALVYGVDQNILQDLRSMRRLFELAAAGDLTMYNPRLKKERRLGQDDVQSYLLERERWLSNEFLLSLVTGGRHPALQALKNPEK